MATVTTTKSKGWRSGNNCRGQEEASCVACGRRPRPACLANATGTTACEDVGVGDGGNNEDKDGDEDGDGNKNEVATKTTTRR